MDWKMAVVPLPPCIHTSVLCDLEASPSKRWSVFPRPWPWACPVTCCGTCDPAPGPGLGLEGLLCFLRFLRNLLSYHVSKLWVSLLEGEGPLEWWGMQEVQKARGTKDIWHMWRGVRRPGWGRGKSVKKWGWSLASCDEDFEFYS